MSQNSSSVPAANDDGAATGRDRNRTTPSWVGPRRLSTWTWISQSSAKVAITRRLAADQRDQCRIGQQHMPGTVQRQNRIGHRRQQCIELQVTTLTGQDIHHCDRLDTPHPEQSVL